MISTRLRIALFVTLASVSAFNRAPVMGRRRTTRSVGVEDAGSRVEPSSDESRRRLLQLSGLVTLAPSLPSFAADFRPATRPLAYRVDSTIPPTLLPIRDPARILQDLGKGLGTDKEAIVVDTVNLNNILNKAVFGTINAVSGSSSGMSGSSNTGPSYVCLGLPSSPTSVDVQLAHDLLQLMKVSSSGALGLACCPLSAQPALDDYLAGRSDSVPSAVPETYTPLATLAKSQGWGLLAMAPEPEDVATARSKGLQFVDGDRRSAYVADPEGFIALVQDPRFKVYTDRSLFKDFVPVSSQDSPANFFAERILVHETAATVAAKSTKDWVALVAPTPDLRFLNGMNGRIPRVYNHLHPGAEMTNNRVTTILLNPTAQDTLSKSRYLRLEVGTGPDSLDYQSKVADYLWFSSSPKVNLIPRMMDG